MPTASAVHMRIFTNNPLVRRHYPEARWVRGTPLAVLEAVRDAVHRGHRLLVHPHLGNLQPNRAYFRSFVLTSRPEGAVESTSITLLENALEALRGFGCPPSPHEREAADLQALDFDLLATGLLRLSPSYTSPLGRVDPCA